MRDEERRRSTYRLRVVDEGVVFIVSVSEIDQVLNPIAFPDFAVLRSQTTDGFYVVGTQC